MAKTELKTVTLEGVYKGQRAVAKWTRSDSLWLLQLSVGGKYRGKRFLVDKGSKPCWTVAVAEMKKLFAGECSPEGAAKPKPKSPRHSLRVFD